MNPKNPSITTLLSSVLLIFLPTLISSQTCQKACGKLPIKYPFGTGPGCGDPRFQPYITCNQQQQQLTFSTHTGCYPITSIDYNTQVIYISDPTISTCSCTQPSKGFGLNWDAPFSFHDDTVFALLDCSPTSSIYRGGNGKNSSFPMCDSQGGSICSLLYSCEAISRLSLPISTCCVYTPVDLGPSFEMDLEKLQCTSYSALYGYNGQESNPQGWNYGIAVKYKFNFDNDYPGLCASCEKSNGVLWDKTISKYVTQLEKK
ncbi:hypothetical protein DH2020_003482 [Rehmannia glutinosa]|uniref:Wall-associated receptor kinase galacturonan-binding domain-containing protein n=1 Tax=Rehmannia glutinosa TaxID=99300 RepID=A0ABR0XLR1_REHGL